MNKLFITNLLLLGILLAGCTKETEKVSLQQELVAQTSIAELTNGVTTKNNTTAPPQINEDNISPKENLSKEHPIDLAERECISRDYSTANMSKCTYTAMDSWLEEIDTNMKKLKSVLSEEDYALLITAQEKWNEFKDAQFESFIIIQAKAGTMFQNIYVGYKKRLVKEYAMMLHHLYETLMIP